MISTALASLPFQRSRWRQRVREVFQVAAAFALLAGPTALLGWWLSPVAPAAAAWCFYMANPQDPLQLLLALAGGLVVGGTAAVTGSLGGVAGMLLMALVGSAALIAANLLELGTKAGGTQQWHSGR